LSTTTIFVFASHHFILPAAAPASAQSFPSPSRCLVAT